MNVSQIPHWVILLAMATVFLGPIFGLSALLTRRQRRNTREIRRAAIERGWKYSVRRWQGNPTAFCIDGQSRSGLPLPHADRKSVASSGRMDRPCVPV